MGLKSVFNALKQEGYIIKPLDMYLLSLNDKDSDRAINVNAPSQASNCSRANYYARLQYPSDGAIDPRSRRIFDNGTGVHERLQAYMLKSGILISDEVPCINDELQIQGHTDGFLNIGKITEKTHLIPIPNKKLKRKVTIKNYSEIAILEIKSINNNGFMQLKDAKEEHKKQAMIYLYCSEERRLYLKKTYKTLEAFLSSEPERRKYHESKYQHVKDGSKYTREEKIQNQVEIGINADNILYNTDKPITKVIFLYEDKNTQELKEYCVQRNDEILEQVTNKYRALNKAIETKQIPEREGTSKSCSTCRFCNYKITCWIV